LDSLAFDSIDEEEAA